MFPPPVSTPLRILAWVVQMPSPTPVSNLFRIGLLPSASFRLTFFKILSIPAATRSSGLPRIARSISSRAIGSRAGMFSPPFTRPLRFVVFDFVAVAFPPLALIDAILFSRTRFQRLSSSSYILQILLFSEDDFGNIYIAVLRLRIGL